MYPLSVKQTYLAVFNSSASSAAVPGLLLGEGSEATEPYNKYAKYFSDLCNPNSFSDFQRLPVTWLNTIWLNFFVESFGLKILSQVTTKLSQLHSNSRNKYVNSRKYHNVGHMRCMHARPHRRKDQLPLRSLRDLRSR